MLVVISIIALIMALVGPRVLNFSARSKVKAAKIQIESLTSALDLYRSRYWTISVKLGRSRGADAAPWRRSELERPLFEGQCGS